MNFKLNEIKKRCAERRLENRRKAAMEEACQEIRPVSRVGRKGELITDIVVCGMPLYQVSDNDGRWNVKADDVGDVIKHLRDAYVAKIMNQ